MENYYNMKILTNTTIIASDANIPNNPLGTENNFGNSINLLNNNLIITDSFQTYIDTNNTKDEDVWFNGEPFPFLIKEINYNGALSLSNSYFTINSYTNSNSNLFIYNGVTSSTIIIDNNGLLQINSKNGFGEFICNTSSGVILTSNNGCSYWGTPGFTATTYHDGYYDVGGLSNTRVYTSTFNFTTNNINSLTYSINLGNNIGLSAYAGGGYNNIDVYHNMNNTYSITTFWALTASKWQILYPELGMLGICSTFSYYSYGNKIKISLTGSIPTNKFQINILS